MPQLANELSREMVEALLVIALERCEGGEILVRRAEYERIRNDCRHVVVWRVNETGDMRLEPTADLSKGPIE